jgi:hypothetical protein
MKSTLTFLRGNAIALLALLVAVGGTSYAAVSLPKDSVKAKQIAKSAVRTAEVKDGTLGGADVQDGSLTSADLQDGSLTSADLQDGSVTAADLQVGTVPLDVTKPLPSGVTIRGFLNGDFHATGVSDWRVSASYPVPLAASPAGGYVDGETPGETCTGTFANPTAPAGALCIYPDGASNPGIGTNNHYVSYSTKWGFSVAWTATAAGDTFYPATWAVTAP